MFGLGPQELILIAIVFLVLFGAKRIPELMQGLGKGVREFKKATGDIEKDINLHSNRKRRRRRKKNQRFKSLHFC